MPVLGPTIFFLASSLDLRDRLALALKGSMWVMDPTNNY